MRASDSIPEALGTNLPAECHAYVNYVFPYQDEDKEWDGRVSKWYKLLDVDPETEVPEVYSRYTPQPLPSSAKNPDGYVSHRLSLPQEEPVVPPVDNDMAEFIHTVKRPKLLSDRPSQQTRPAHLTPTVLAPDDSFVLDGDGC